MHAVLVKARGALQHKGLLEPRCKAQKASVRLIEAKRTFLKNNLKFLKLLLMRNATIK